MTGLALRQEGSRHVRELWVELSASMRLLRTSSGTSLRQAELASGRSRGTLSQVENGKARPTRDLVEWYDATFDGDGLLLSIYAEARGAHGRPQPRSVSLVRAVPGDDIRVESPLLPHGALVGAGATVIAGWTLVNAGSMAWTGRQLRRVGTPAAVRLIGSPASVPIAECAPGDRVVVEVSLTVPGLAGTYAAYWQVVDTDGVPSFETMPPLAVVLTAGAVDLGASGMPT